MRHRDEVVTLTSHAAALLRMEVTLTIRDDGPGFAPEILVVTFGADGLVNGVTRVPESFGGGRTGRR